MSLPTSLSRRAALGGLAFGGLSSVGLPFGGPASGQAAATAADPGATVVATRHGQVRGRRAGAATVFQGIPYGADTASRRFMPSGPPPAWDGVRDAGAFGPIAPQMRPGRPSIYSSWANPQPESEDCLNLNVYTPGLDARGRRPVMVWIHGGGFVSGSSALRYADGARLAAKGEVVVVTVNHRLGALGYLFVPELGAAYADSGNAGTSDMILALEWVRDNISGFGGDPANVTIFGQSGGGAKVSTLWRPRARGPVPQGDRAEFVQHTRNDARRGEGADGTRPGRGRRRRRPARRENPALRGPQRRGGSGGGALQSGRGRSHAAATSVRARRAARQR